MTPRGFDPDWFLYVDSIGNTGKPWDGVYFGTEPVPVAVCSRVEVFEGEKRLEARILEREPGAIREQRAIPIENKKLGHGRHKLRVVVSPDPAAALERSATLREILGAKFEREFDVEVP